MEKVGTLVRCGPKRSKLPPVQISRHWPALNFISGAYIGCGLTCLLQLWNV